MPGWMDAEQRVQRAHDLYGKGRLVEAAAELQAAIDVNPHNGAWLFNLGLTLEAMGDHLRACQAYRKALAIDGDDIESLLCLGINLTRLSRYEDALECFEHVERIDPSHEPCYCHRITTYCEMGQHDKAELMFYLARLFKDRCPDCYCNIAASFYARGMYDHAVNCLVEALRIDPQFPQAHACIAEARWAQGKLDEARSHYESELRVGVDDTETLVDLGELLIEMNLAEEAEHAFTKALAKASDHAGAHFGLGQVALDSSKLSKAEMEFRLVLQTDPDYPGAHAMLARVLLRRQRFDAAAKQLLSELKMCGDDPATLQEIGRLFVESRRPGQANTVFRKLVRLNPLDAHARHGLAVSCFLLRNLDEGIMHCRRALKLKPDYALALYNLAVAHLHKGELTRARRYATKALTISPHDHRVLGLFESLRHRAVRFKLPAGLRPGRHFRTMRH